MRTYIYIDGFNLYHLALQRSRFKWLDFKKLFSKLLNEENEIIKINYYTSYSSGKYENHRPHRQNIYHRALRKHIPELEIIYGYFNTFPVSMRLESNPNKFVKVLKTEEKCTDVNLAVQMVNDGWKGLYDCAVVLTNDGDFEEALRIVRDELNLVVGLITPRHTSSKKLDKYISFRKTIRNGVLRDSQLPNPIPNSNLYKPESW